jgi:hypothetical protein
MIEEFASFQINDLLYQEEDKIKLDEKNRLLNNQENLI